ncbi:MAG: MBL fold metallo-hydrolase [Cyanobacteria bacterium J06639_14]
MKQLRQWIVGLVIAIAALVGVISVQAQTPTQATDELTLAVAGLNVEEVADGVYTFLASTDFPPAEPATTAICNATVVIGSDGALIVDPFQNEALTELLFESVTWLTNKPIRYVVNTHYHFDHSGGNAAVAAAGYAILGRGPIREFMLENNLDLDPNATPPNLVLNGDGEVWLGDRRVQLAEFEGHSGGTDLIVYVPDADVLIAGDLAFTERIPYVGDGNIRLWQANLEQLATQYSTATIVPGHGPISDRTDLEQLQGYLEYLEALALAWQAEGLSQEDAIAQTTIAPEYANYLFQGLFTNGLETAYQQITLGQEDAAAMRAYFAVQPPELQAL